MIRTRHSLALAVVAAVTLAACGDDADDATDDAAATSTESTQLDDMDDEMGDDMDDDMDDDMGDEMDDDMGDDMDDDMSDMGDDMDDDMSDDMSDDMGDEMSDDMGDDMSDDMGDDMAMNDVMSVIVDQDGLSTLDAAIHAAGLQQELHDGGPFTVFAPNDAAFDAYFSDMGMSIESADADALTALLLAHVVEGTDDAAMVMGMDGQSFTTLAGTELAITVDGDDVLVGDATVVEYDIAADNGVVHVIDTVLTP